MEKHFFSRFRLHATGRIENGREVTEGTDSGVLARLTSFIMAWLLAIFFCLVFWYGVYLLLRSLLPRLSEGG